MEIEKIIGLGIVGMILAVTVKNYRPEIGICVALITGISIFFSVIPGLKNAIDGLYNLCRDSGLDTEGLGAIIKIIGISYLTQFSCELCRDAGEGAIAKKLELAGKAVVLVLMLPIIENLMDVIIGTLMSF